MTPNNWKCITNDRLDGHYIQCIEIKENPTRKIVYDAYNLPSKKYEGYFYVFLGYIKDYDFWVQPFL